MLSIKELSERILKYHALQVDPAIIARDILASPSLAVLLAAPSWKKHPLGFLQLQLAEVEGVALRLHVWPKNRTSSEDDPDVLHSHPWPLWSYVLLGELENVLIAVAADPKGRDLLYKVERRGSKVIREREERAVSWKETLVTQVRAPGSYQVPMGVFHTSRPGVDGALTLIVAGPRGNSVAKAVMPEGYPILTTHITERVNLGVLRRTFSEIYAANTPENRRSWLRRS